MQTQINPYWYIVIAALTVFAISAQECKGASLNDPDGYLYDLSSDVSKIINGTSDAYDGGYVLSINGTVYSASGSTLSGRHIIGTTETISGLQVARKFYVPDSKVGSLGNFGRWYESLYNPTGSTITVTIEYYTNLGSDSSTVVTRTSDGDTAVEISDEWVATDDSSDGGGDPSLGHVVFLSGASKPIDSMSAPTGSIRWEYSSVSIQPGQTIGLLTFAIQEANRASSWGEAEGVIESLRTGDLNSIALRELTLDEYLSLVNIAVAPPDELRIEPLQSFVASGPIGGPFTPSVMNYTLTNTGSDSIDWTAAVNEAWLTVTPAGGTLAGGVSATVEVRINSHANSLTTGIYDDNVVFSNLTSGFSVQRNVKLTAGLKRILAYTQYADMGREYPNTIQAIESVDTNYTLSTLDDYTQLDTMLPGCDILLVPEQERASLSTLVNVGVAWRTSLQNFVNNGGVVILCDHVDRYGILTGAELMNITNSVDGADFTVHVVDSSDPVAQGVSSSYLGMSGSTYYMTSEGTVVVERSGLGPVVINKEYGMGNVVLIGHDYYNSNIDQDKIVGNAVFNLPSVKDVLRIISGSTLFTGHEGGPFSPTEHIITLTNTDSSPLDWSATVTVPWLEISPAGGTLAAGASTSLTVSLNTNANGLSAGNYSDTITVSNLTSGVDQALEAQLEVVMEQFKLLASDGYSEDQFGRAVSIDGDYAIVGAYQDDDNGGSSGSAYIFHYDGSSWTQQAKLTANDGSSSDEFGVSVSIDGDTAIVGADRDDDSGSDSGSAYVFKRSGATWIQQAKLTAGDGYSSDHFGYSVSIDGDAAIVGAYGDDDSGNNSGSAYVFQRSGTTWIKQAKLTSNDGSSSDYFGVSVSIDGDTAIVGAHRDDDSGGDSGSAYVFKRSGETWIQQAKLTAGDGSSSDYFGYSVSIDGDAAIVGAYGDDDSGSDSGSAYVFKRSGETWIQQAKLTAGDGSSSDYFGYSVSIDGDAAIVGAYGDDDSGSDSGSAYVFKQSGAAWSTATETVKLVPQDGASGDNFGFSVSVSNGLSVIGVLYDDDNGSNSGSAYLFGNADPLHVSAAVSPEDFICSGDEGGPFVPLSKVYVLTNNDPNALIDWTAEISQPWLDIAPAAGTLAAGATVSLEVTLNANVDALIPGNYSDVILFSNTTTGTTQSRRAELEVLAVPGEIEIVDSIPEPNMPFGDVIVGLTATETVTVRNVDPVHSLLISQIGNFVDFDGFFEEFESTTLDPEKWTITAGVPTIDSVGLDEPSEPYSLRLNGYGSVNGHEEITSVPMDFSDLSDLVLVYWYERTGGGEDPDGGEDLIISFWDGFLWTELDRQLGNGSDMYSYEQRIIVLPQSAMHSNFRLKIEKGPGSDCDCDDWFVDDIAIVHADQIAAVVDTNRYDVFSMIELNEPFTLVGVPEMPLTLPPMSELTFEVVFEPDEKEDYAYDLMIVSDDRDESEVHLEISGTGIDDYLEIAPEEDVVFTGHPGGPFMPSAHTYQLTNTGPVDVDWMADPNMPWIIVIPESGTLSSGETTEVEVEWTQPARTLPPGLHTDILTLRNLTTTMHYERMVSVNVYTEAKAWNSPLSFTASTPYATLLSDFLTIGNTGDAALQYSLRAVLDDYTPLSQAASQSEAAGTGELASAVKSDIAEGLDLTVVNGTSPYIEGEVLVRFSQVSAVDVEDTAWLDGILQQMGGASVVKEYPLVPGLKLVRLPDEITVEDALTAYSAMDGIQYVQPNYEVNVNETHPNDIYYSNLWGMHNTGQTGGNADADIDAPEAWDLTTGSDNVIVAVIDTGIDYGHPDLIDNIWINEQEYNGENGVDDDGNGYIDDIYGYDFAYHDNDPYDGHYHGTHCAGTIGASGNNSQGVAGVCWNVQLMAVKFLNNSGNGNDADAIESIQYAVSMGAKIMSCSWGGGSYNQALKDVIDAAGAAGVTMVAAAGNAGSNNDTYPHYPSSYDCDNIIAVINTDNNDNRSNNSCYGLTSVDLGAPGSSIYSCEPGNRYQYLSGTSMATPHVSGACALMLARNAALTVPEMKDILLRTVDPTLPNLCVSGGRLNLFAALSEVPEQNGGVGGAWIQFASDSGVVAPHDANDVEVIFDGGRTPGVYTGRILLTTNDLYNPEITIPVTFTVQEVDYCTQIFDPNGNDLSYQSFVFKQDALGNYYNACKMPATEFFVDPNESLVADLRDDDYLRVDLTDQVFNFYGVDYDRFYIGSNGYLTFDTGDYFHMESLEYHFSVPRIAALFDDLDPDAGGLVSYKQLDDRMVVTYENIREYGLTGSNSFQIEMLFDGTIRMTFLEISATDGLVGLSNGLGVSPLFFESDYDQYGKCDFKADLNNDLRSNLLDFAMLSRFWMMQETAMGSVRDEFNSVSYAGNDGMFNWSSDWLETGEGDGCAAGMIMVAEDGRLKIGHESASHTPAVMLTRQVDMRNATTATLSFDYEIINYENKGVIDVQVSTDGGVTWVTIDTFVPNSGSGSSQYDLTPYISAATDIRFLLEEAKKLSVYLYVDNVQVSYDSPDVPWYPWCNGSDIDKNFKVDLDDLIIFGDHWLE